MIVLRHIRQRLPALSENGLNIPVVKRRRRRPRAPDPGPARCIHHARGRSATEGRKSSSRDISSAASPAPTFHAPHKLGADVTIVGPSNSVPQLVRGAMGSRSPQPPHGARRQAVRRHASSHPARSPPGVGPLPSLANWTPRHVRPSTITAPRRVKPTPSSCTRAHQTAGSRSTGDHRDSPRSVILDAGDQRHRRRHGSPYLCAGGQPAGNSADPGGVVSSIQWATKCTKGAK